MAGKTVLIATSNTVDFQLIKAVCSLLDQNGHTIVTINKVKGELPAGVQHYPFDLENHQAKGVMQIMHPDTVIHIVDGGLGDDPKAYYQKYIVNALATLNLGIDAAVRNFVFVSVGEHDGGSGDAPIILEGIVEHYAQAYGITHGHVNYAYAPRDLDQLALAIMEKI